MNIRQLRTVGCAAALVLAFGVAGFTPVLAHAKDPAPLFTTGSYPRVDGIASAQPLGLGYFRDSTGEDIPGSDVVFDSESDAYSNLIGGDADLILATAPTADEVAKANEAAVEFQTIPVAQSRLVIVADAANPVDSLTIAQLRDIYSGAITDWGQVGGNPGPITAYQRSDGSGSQVGMLDLVMKGTPMMDPPTGVSRWMGTVAQTVTAFTPTPGAVGYAYSYYIEAIWPDLLRDGTADGVKVINVAGVSPDPSVANYPLTTTYDIVMKASEPKNSPARTLAAQMVSPHGQMVASSAGYLPVAPVDPPDPTPSVSSAPSSSVTPASPHPSVSATPASTAVDSPAQSTQTYAANPLTVTTKVGYVRAALDGTPYCALVERATIQGLTDAELQVSLMAEFVSRQDSFLMQAWGVDRLIAASSCADNAVPDLVLRTFTTGNFSNVLSLVSSWGVPGSPGPHDPAATLNVRLDSGEELAFSDLFAHGTNIADLIQAQALSSDPQATEQEILSWVDEYRQDPQQSFSFSATSATLYLPGVANGEDTGVSVGYASQWDKVTVFDIASSATGLYTPPAGPEPSVENIGPIPPQTNVVDETPVVMPENSVLSITSAPVSIVTDPCTGLTVTTPDTFTAEVSVVDSQGKPVPEAVVAFSTTDAMMLTQQYVTADDHGIATVMAIMDQAALLRGEIPTLSATILRDDARVDVAGSGVQVPVTIIAPPVPETQPQATIVGSDIPADNASSYTVAVEWSDGCGVPMAGQTVQFSVDGSAALSSSSAVLDDRGRAEITVKDPVAEVVSVHAEAPTASGPVLVQGLTQLEFMMAVPDPLQSSAGVNDTIVAIGCDEPGSTTLTAMVKDKDGRPLYLHKVYLSVSGTAQLSDPVPVTDSHGMVSVSLTDEVPETVIVTVSLESGQDIPGTPLMVSFVPGCAPPSSSSMWFSLTQGPRVADGDDAYTVTIYAKDVNGGPVRGLADQFQISEASGTVTVGAVTENSDGTYTSTLTSTQAGTFSVRVTMGMGDQARDLAGSPQQVVFIPSWEPSMTMSVAPAGPSALITVQISARTGKLAPAPLAGQASLLSATARDSDGAITTDVSVGPFREEKPGVYTAVASWSKQGDYQVSVSWKEPGASVLTIPDRRLMTSR